MVTITRFCKWLVFFKWLLLNCKTLTWAKMNAGFPQGCILAFLCVYMIYLMRLHAGKHFLQTMYLCSLFSIIHKNLQKKKKKFLKQQTDEQCNENYWLTQMQTKWEKTYFLKENTWYDSSDSYSFSQKYIWFTFSLKVKTWNTSRLKISVH